ncbi:hypothetical protein DMC01_04665 [Campylobacter troglodytis]|nr:hypothetical protein DMC01_04665 [Campylobacter troglodytis]
MIYLNFNARLTRKKYIIFWLSVVIFGIFAVATILQGISLTRRFFRIAFDIKHPKWHLGDLMTLFAFGFSSILAVAIPIFFVSTANRLSDCGISAWFLLPLFVLMWLWGVHLFQLDLGSALIYKAISLVLFFYFIIILFLALFAKTR